MKEISEKMELYFNRIQDEVNQCYQIAEKARMRGLDPELFVESPQARDLAGRVEKLIGPQGIADIIRELKSQNFNDDQIVFKVVSDILDQKIGNIDRMEDRVERAIRAGLAIKTMGVVSAPLEGISKVLIKEDQNGDKYLSLYFAGPIRAAGGTTAALCVLIADYVREKSGIPKYMATEGEIGRYVEEIKLYDRSVHLQYPSSNNEIRFAVKSLSVEINGDPTEDVEVSAFRDLPRIDTNNIRGGACLVLNDGILLKAPKLLKIARSMNINGWEWLAELKKIALEEGTEESQNEKPSSSAEKEKKKIVPNPKYIKDIIAGRPVFGDPSIVGGHRIRYGRSRNTGLAAGGMHPATLAILDNFVAIGTQLRIERPGKSTSICPVSSIEPPIVKLKNGDVIKATSYEKAREIFPEVSKILFLGDILFGFGEFAENNHVLIPSGYVEEWWALDLENALKSNPNTVFDVSSYLSDPFNHIPTAEEAINISKTLGVPLHPVYLDFWNNLTVEEGLALRNAFLKGYSNGIMDLDDTPQIKEILEKAFILHHLKEGKIIFSKAMNLIYKEIFDLDHKNDFQSPEFSDIFDFFSHISSIKIKNKAPYFMGTRMGRPEKSERKSMKGVQALFPLSDKVGSSRKLEKAVELEKINIDVCRKKCSQCGTISIFNKCPKCGQHTEPQKICEKCKKFFPKNEETCDKCGNVLKFSNQANFNIKNHVLTILKKYRMSLPDNVKGIIGLTNKFKIPEPLEKGILRAKNDVLVYKTAEIRYDATDIPLTHFKPKEIGISIAKLKDLGYDVDHVGAPIESENQIVELRIQDVVLSDDCADYLIKVANFLDDELEYFYGMERFYHVSKREDLIGHLIVGLAPHTSAGIIGRVIGFSPARSIYAHPFWHSAKRRNCDGDEDGVMLLLDPILNFSRYYLPSKIGGRMDATLVISSVLDPNEIEPEAHNIDTLSKYPLEFYEATLNYPAPGEIEKIMKLVKTKLGTPDQYENIEYNIPTEDINAGGYVSAYKTYESMDDKIEAQMHLAQIIRAVDEKNVAKKILSTHFTPDILGNLRKFAVQGFRCVKCNASYRKPPLSNAGKCTKCGGHVILTVNRAGIEKYIPRAKQLCEDFKLDEYTIQRMELIEEYVSSLTNNPKIRQQKLSDFF